MNHIMISVTEQLNTTLVPLIHGLYMQIKIIFKKSLFYYFSSKHKLWIHESTQKKVKSSIEFHILR